MSDSVSEEILEFFIDKMFEITGMVFHKKDHFRIIPRLIQLQKELNCEGINDLYNKYNTQLTPLLKTVLIDTFTNNETFFYRDPKQIEVLGRKVFPEIVKDHGSNLNLWSAASSTGQEVYSMLISIESHCKPQDFVRVKATATDISSQALKTAKEGIYTSMDIQRGLPAKLMLKFFTQLDDGRWALSDKIKSKVEFKEFNLLDAFYPKDQYHVIFCRNVLIYQNIENRKKIVSHLYNALQNKGYLFLGTGETLHGVNKDFKQLTIDGATFYKKEI